MPVKIFALVTDAFGGWGGIAHYNRDFLRALCSHRGVRRVVCIPRLAPGVLGEFPAKLTFDTSGVQGIGSYLRAVTKNIITGGGWDLIYCGHINLVPLAVLLGAVLRMPVVLQVHGIDASRAGAACLRAP